LESMIMRNLLGEWSTLVSRLMWLHCLIQYT